MTKKPNPIKHMLKRGAINGLVIGIIWSILLTSLVVFIGIVEQYIKPSDFSFALDFLSFCWLIYGVISVGGLLVGSFLGLLNGILIWLFTHRAIFPLTKKDRSWQRTIIYSAVTIFTILYSIILSIPLLREIPIIMLLYIPISLMFLIASVYEAHLYLVRLHKWSKQFDLRKRKPKNDHIMSERLSENTSSDAMLIEDTQAQQAEGHSV